MGTALNDVLNRQQTKIQNMQMQKEKKEEEKTGKST